MAMENLSQYHFVHHKSHADCCANELLPIGKTNNFTHFISFASAYVVLEHLFLYLQILFSECFFLVNL